MTSVSGLPGLSIVSGRTHRTGPIGLLARLAGLADEGTAHWGGWRTATW